MRAHCQPPTNAKAAHATFAAQLAFTVHRLLPGCVTYVYRPTESLHGVAHLATTFFLSPIPAALVAHRLFRPITLLHGVTSIHFGGQEAVPAKTIVRLPSILPPSKPSTAQINTTFGIFNLSLRPPPAPVVALHRLLDGALDELVNEIIAVISYVIIRRLNSPMQTSIESHLLAPLVLRVVSPSLSPQPRPVTVVDALLGFLQLVQAGVCTSARYPSCHRVLK